MICVFLVQYDMSAVQWGYYLAVTAAASVISSIVGMFFGIFAKNQVSASTITTPGILVFMMIPMFSGISEKIEHISGYLFTGIVFDAIGNINAGDLPVDLKGVLVLAGECVLSVAVFLILYRKNGFER